MCEDNKIVLKFRAVKERLDWRGNVIEDVKETDYEWDGYDPKIFLDSVIKNGDLRNVAPPTNCGFSSDFFEKLFNPDNKFKWRNYEILKEYKTVESLPINGNKFVVYSRNDRREMFWTTED